MAENNENRTDEDLTEEPSAYRLEEFRRRGMVAQSKELTALLALCAAGVMTYAMTPTLGSQLAEFMQEVFRTDLSSKVDLGQTGILSYYLMKAVKVAGYFLGPIFLGVIVLGVLGSFTQVGSIFTWEPVTPDWSRINPLSGFQKIFSPKQLVEMARFMLKMVAVVWVAYTMLKTEVFRTQMHYSGEAQTTITEVGRAVKAIFLSLMSVVAVFAVIDFIMQKRQYRQKVRMTKQEAKQEAKEHEGDPQLKARIRSIQRDVARKRMMQAVKTADVIVTNPTHIAVAIKYDRGKMSAPKVVAKGADFLAQRIKKMAADNGVPLVENVPLARALFKSVKVGRVVPRELYQAVAEVLAYVYRLKNRRG